MGTHISGDYTEINFLEFHNRKKQLPSGIYLVVEHDGSHNVARVTSNGLWNEIDWFSVQEWEDLQQREHQARMDDAALDAIMRFDPL
ncbi:hypothetical protein AVT69_gp120 [Pseudomonas phage PhiPA3]|uniref:Uncharacterized protein 121 n=1 Tax=Pseudomonas phage PhiPA3 TaxID=998086 RepID=F8SJZ5_BPPA3|nr:hypothetical protein AVT69_gp120 [Pseudomonas phage PhiPA3]AEH03545.1 hypothetical protein [Pseudomonas phage PhiPA3]